MTIVVTSAYSEHQVYLEGYVATNLSNDHIVSDRINEIKMYFAGDETAKVSLIKAGVSVVVYRNITNDIIPKEKILYKNNDIIIGLI